MKDKIEDIANEIVERVFKQYYGRPAEHEDYEDRIALEGIKKGIKLGRNELERELRDEMERMIKRGYKNMNFVIEFLDSKKQGEGR